MSSIFAHGNCQFKISPDYSAKNSALRQIIKDARINAQIYLNNKFIQTSLQNFVQINQKRFFFKFLNFARKTRQYINDIKIYNKMHEIHFYLQQNK